MLYVNYYYYDTRVFLRLCILVAHSAHMVRYSTKISSPHVSGGWNIEILNVRQKYPVEYFKGISTRSTLVDRCSAHTGGNVAIYCTTVSLSHGHSTLTLSPRRVARSTRRDNYVRVFFPPRYERAWIEVKHRQRDVSSGASRARLGFQSRAKIRDGG